MVNFARLNEEGGAEASDLQPMEFTDEFITGSMSEQGSPTSASPLRSGQEKMARREAATVMQRWYRKQVIKYGTFGPMIFTRKDGKIADYGKLSFSAGYHTVSFLRISDTTSAPTLSHFIEKYWRLRRPDVLISVTGSAASLQLTSLLQRVFDRGLAAAAAMTNAWIFTGGTDSGVMKLVGDAMHKGGLIDVPVVGIAPWNAVHGRATLEGCKGQEVFVRYKSSDTEGRLNPYHTHQILVDSGSNAATWGGEIALRARLERTYATQKGVPVVLLVVQGGPGTLDMMLASAELGCPLLVLADSGGAASAIAQFCESGIEGVEDPAFVASEAKLSSLQNLHASRGSTLLSFFRLHDEDSQNNLSTAILAALFNNLMFHETGQAVHGNNSTPNTVALGRASVGERMAAASAEVLKRYRDHMQRALLLTVKWNQPTFAKRILSDLPASHDHSRPIRKMLQHALEFQRVEIVDMLLERPGVEVAAVNLCQLYLSEDPYNFFRSELANGLRDRLHASLSEIARDGQTASYYEQSYRLYKRVVGPTFEALSLHIHSATESQTVCTPVDLFFWSVFMGDARLARELWSHVDNPLHCALLASNLLRVLCRTIAAGKEEAEAAAEEIESWAIGVLDEISEQELAHWLLSKRVPAWHMGSLIHIALQMNAKRFLTHRHCQSLFDLRWRGGSPDSDVLLSSNHSLLQIFTYAFVIPFANPYMRSPKPDAERGMAAQARRRRHASGDAADADDGDMVDREELLLDALAEAFTLKEYEKRNAIAALHAEESAMEAERVAAHAAAEVERKAAVSAQVQSERAQGGASTPAADASSRNLLAHPKKIGPSGMKVRTLSSLKRSKLKSTRQLTQQQSFSFGRSTRSLVRGDVPEAQKHARFKTGFYSVPLVKYLLRALLHVVFLILYAEVLTHLMTIDQLTAIAPKLPPLTTAEGVLLLWSLTLGYEHRRRELSMRAFGLSTNMPLKVLVNTAHVILAVAIVLRATTLVPSIAHREAYTAYQMLVSVDAVLMMCEMFTFMWTSMDFGVLAITLVNMITDLSLFLIFFSVVLIGFCLALIGLSETAPHQQHIEEGSLAAAALTESPSPAGPRGLPQLLTPSAIVREDFRSSEEHPIALMWQPFWAMFAEFDLDQLKRIPFGLPLMWSYVLIANIVLVNMLIAMFAETYTRIKRNALTEYRYQHYLHIFEYMHVVHAIPPPLNLLFLFWDTCVATFSARETKANLARMNIDDGYDDSVDYGPPQGLGQHDGQPAGQMMRKFVARYLKNHTDLTAANSTMGLAKRLERRVGDMEEMMTQQFDTMHNALVVNPVGASRTDQKLALIAQMIDRLAKGKSVSEAASLVSSNKAAMRAEAARGPGSQSSTRTPGGKPPGGMTRQQSKPGTPPRQARV